MFTKFMTRNMFPHLTDNAPFGGSVVPVETRDPAVEIIERTPPSLQQRLLAVPIADPKLRQRRQTLVSELAAATMQAEDFLEEITTQRHAALENELEEIRAQGRQQLAVVEQLQIEHERAVMNVRNLREESENLGEQVKNLRRAPISKWASKETRAARQKKIVKLQEQLNALVRDIVVAGQQQQAAWHELGEAREVMNEISNAEARIRGQLSGKPYTDPEYGMVVSPII